MRTTAFIEIKVKNICLQAFMIHFKVERFFVLSFSDYRSKKENTKEE